MGCLWVNSFIIPGIVIAKLSIYDHQKFQRIKFNRLKRQNSQIIRRFNMFNFIDEKLSEREKR